jgi:dipeptidyl aminopeptidase/acylaminoacyl peptidase
MGGGALAAACLVTAAASAGSEAPSSSKTATRDAGVRLTAADLVGLSDFGPAFPNVGEHILSLSPDHKMIAVQVRTAVPSANRYLISVNVIDLTSRRSRTIDAGGDFMLQYVSGLGNAMVSTGYAAATPLIWSGDGKWVYFLKRLAGTTQIWRAAASGARSESVTHEAQGVDDFDLLTDGRRLVYWSRQRDSAREEALKAEALRGFRYDARFIPLFADGPQVSATRRVTKTIDLSTGHVSEAAADEVAEIERSILAAKAGPIAMSKESRRAFVQSAEGQQDSGVGKVAVRRGSREAEVCASPACTGAVAIWWTKDGKVVRFIRRDGWGKGQTAIYEWKPGAPHPKRLYATADLLLDCQPLGQDLVCARERSADPRHVVLLNPDTGHASVVYDANEAFHRFSLGAIERLQWRNEFGIETFGDLVYPVGYQPGRTYPLIVVQYISRGFLRGGVGDEFPIQLFANHGYAVLSVQRPESSLLPLRSGQNGSRRDSLLKDFIDRRSVLSAIEIAVQNLISRGIVDPKQVGITGLSDGSSTVQFALINSSIFSAASASGCCWEPYQDAIVGPGPAKAYHESGWPMLVNYNSEFWSHMSLVENAARITAPLLIQQSDDEFRGAIASYTALKQAKRTAALYVFPDEHHVKWQPAHRLAAYERNLRWFDFWLRGIGDGREWQSDD